MAADPILTFDKTRRINAELIVACRDLGYLSDDRLILDATYGKGRFWKLWWPERLVTNDIDPATDAAWNLDYRAMHLWFDGMYDAVVFDPEYKLNGTSTGKGPASSDADYGVAGKYRPMAARTEGWWQGLAECARVCAPGGFVLVKIMDQVVSGNRRFLVKEVWDYATDDLGLRQVDELYLYGTRKQPARTRKCPTCDGSGILGCVGCDDPECACPDCDETGRVESPQQHAQQSLSTLMVFVKDRR